MSLSTFLLKAWASAERREAGHEEASGGDVEGVVQALHAISFTLRSKGADQFLKRALVLSSQAGCD